MPDEVPLHAASDAARKAALTTMCCLNGFMT
jgi:hypothetical protein